MKTNILFIIVLSLFISCGKKEEKKGGGIIVGNPGQQYDNAVLEQYVLDFEDTMNARGGISAIYFSNLNNTSIIFGQSSDFPSGVIGLCSIGSSGRVIKINPEFWYLGGVDLGNRHQLMFHELGHCVFNLAHDNSSTSGRPTSVMNAYHFSSSIYKTYFSSYMLDLFDSSDVGFQSFVDSNNPFNPSNNITFNNSKIYKSNYIEAYFSATEIDQGEIQEVHICNKNHL
jgi:hypothetical protein